jgi:hypothetical protein
LFNRQERLEIRKFARNIKPASSFVSEKAFNELKKTQNKKSFSFIDY